MQRAAIGEAAAAAFCGVTAGNWAMGTDIAESGSPPAVSVLAIIRRSAMTFPPGAEPGYRRTPLSAEEKARGEANFAPFVAQILVASGRFRVSADTPDQVELFQGVARRVSDILKRPVVSYANGREIVITFGREEAPALL